MSQSLPLGPGSRLVLVDASSFVFRAYHQSLNQDPKYNARPSDGLPTGAVRMFFTKLYQFVRIGAAGVTPTHLGIVFDKGSRDSFRRELYPEYKANRDETPADLKPQMPLAREAVRAFGLSVIELDRTEADDLIATYATAAEAAGAEVIIVSADKDLQQLVSPLVRFYDAESGSKGKPGYRPERNLDVEAVVAKWEGVQPNQIGDILALVGDTSDNVPGVPGIGVKTAAQLLLEYGSLENLLGKASGIKQPKRRENLMAHVDAVRLSRRLVELDTGLDMPVDPADLALPASDGRRLIAFLKALELPALAKRVAKEFDIDEAGVVPDPALASTGAGASASVEAPAGSDLPELPPFDRASCETVSDPKRLAEIVAAAREAGRFGLHINQGGSTLGVALSIGPGTTAYVPLEHRDGGDGLFGSLAAGQMPASDAWAALAPVLEDPGVAKVCHDAKVAVVALASVGIGLRGFDDVMLMSYAVEAGLTGYGLGDLSRRHLHRDWTDPASLGGTGRGKVSLEAVSPIATTPVAGEQADAVLRLHAVLNPKLDGGSARKVYDELELPLVFVLARMEAAGIKVDRPVLAGLSRDFGATLARLETEIHALAGGPFQISSPKQIGEVLFDKLGLPGGKRTGSGQWATGANILEELAAGGHELPKHLLDWRRTAKLKSTYADALLVAADRGTDRVHTHFSLAATTTGRLSSSEPNLQNIPIRTEEGRRIRSAFVASSGHVILSADYSQIELRLLAHIAAIPEMRQAFADGIDIHSATASEMFGVPLDEVSGELRRRAKTINFGIVYGISAFGLSERLGIPRHEAAAFIDGYFTRFPGIRDYIEGTKAACRDDGFVTTQFGRVCHYPGIRAGNASERQAVERQAINAPIQGTAADIIRRAMIRMEPALAGAGLKARMLLQVHDELVFEVPETEAPDTAALVSRVMSEAANPDINLSVPLVVDVRWAENWERAH